MPVVCWLPVHVYAPAVPHDAESQSQGIIILHWVSDLRELNKCIACQEYPIHIIYDILKKRKDYLRLFSNLHISMQYYTFELNK